VWNGTPSSRWQIVAKDFNERAVVVSQGSTQVLGHERIKSVAARAGSPPPDQETVTNVFHYLIDDT
jgi:hypothetical protein